MLYTYHVCSNYSCISSSRYVEAYLYGCFLRCISSLNIESLSMLRYTGSVAATTSLEILVSRNTYLTLLRLMSSRYIDV